MKRNKASQIGELIQQFLRREGIESPLNEQRLLEAWKNLSPAITAATRQLYIKNQILFVYLNSAALRQELQMNRQLLLKKLNAQVGASVITEIIFR